MSLEIKNLTFSYMTLPLCKREAKEVKTVFTGFNATFESGVITALTGDNGSGKTTLARLIMGILKPDNKGEHFYIDGLCFDNWTLAKRGSNIGYVMQNPEKQIFNNTVLSEVKYGLLNKGLADYEADNLAKHYINMFGLEHHIDDFPFNLSMGEKQRLVLASVIAMQPKYLILDEPTANLDSNNSVILGNLLNKIAKHNNEEIQNCGIVLISHDRKFIERYCDMEVNINEKP